MCKQFVFRNDRFHHGRRTEMGQKSSAGALFGGIVKSRISGLRSDESCLWK